MSPSQNAPSVEVIDLADILRSIRNGWRTVVACTVAGVMIGAAFFMIVPPRFDGKASVVLKSGSTSNPASSLAVALGTLAEGGSGGGGASVLPSMPSVATEVEILRSRALAAELVDSLGLQALVAEPRAQAPRTVFIDLSLPGSFKKRKYAFVETEPASTPRSYRFEGPEDTGTAVVGAPARLAVGTVTLAPTAPGGRFEVEFQDKEDATTRLVKAVQIEKPKSDVAHIVYAGDDSVTAAAVPNLLMTLYFDRRRGVDRGINQRMAEFLSVKLDSVGRELVRQERALRAEREATGVVDPLMQGRVDFENENRLRQQLTDIQVQEGALQQLVTQIREGKATVKQLASYPPYLGNGPISSIVGNLIAVETERQALLEQVTEEDDRVRSATVRARSLEAQLLPLAQTTLNTLSAQRTSLQQRLDAVEKALTTIPQAAEVSGRLEREILASSRIYAGLQTELVKARLAAINEGGDVRILDRAVVPKKPAFPRKSVSLAGGLGGGLFIGIIIAVLLGVAGGSMYDERDVERRTGIAAVRLDQGAPLLVGGAASRTILVAPVSSRAVAKPVAERLAQTAVSRALTATVLDLTTASVNGNRLLTPASGSERLGELMSFDANAAISRLEETHDLVVVQLPDLTGHTAGAVLSALRPVLLVAPERRIERSGLQHAVDLLRRVGAPCAGVVLHGDDRRRIRA